MLCRVIWETGWCVVVSLCTFHLTVLIECVMRALLPQRTPREQSLQPMVSRVLSFFARKVRSRCVPISAIANYMDSRWSTVSSPSSYWCKHHRPSSFALVSSAVSVYMLCPKCINIYLNWRWLGNISSSDQHLSNALSSCFLQFQNGI